MSYILKYWWHRPNPATVHLETLQGIPSHEEALAALVKADRDYTHGGYYISKAVIVAPGGAEEKVRDDGHLALYPDRNLVEHAPMNYTEQAQ